MTLASSPTTTWLGQYWARQARLGASGPGRVGCDATKARQARHGKATLGRSRCGWVRQGKAGKAGVDCWARHEPGENEAGEERHGRAGNGLACTGEAGKA
jgi:hypothetical protein